MRTRVGGCIAGLALLAGVSTALAHELDHEAEPFSQDARQLSANANAGGENAEWEYITSIPTGNPHTDLDFFTIDDITYASVGTLAAGPNAAGQTIVQLTNDEGEVVNEDDEPFVQYVSGHPSATCPGIATGVTGLQHDAEAGPKGDALVQFPNPFVDTSDTQIVVDTTDANGRCHDQGTLGISGTTKQGGLEIIDVTDPAAPKEIGLTSHVGEAHTVNIDPKRPHIAFVSGSDSVPYNAEGVRANDEHPASPPAAPGAVTNLMDGIEVVDLSTCMNFLPGATLELKREACRPKVYRYRWPNVDFARSSIFRATAACHEIEIYPDDRLTCAGVDATLLLDFSNAFDDNGTPTDYSDDHPRGTPLPCAVRASSTPAESPWTTKAMVTDCVVGDGDQSLRVPDWRKLNPPPSLEGVEKIGAVHHMGFEDQRRENTNPPYDSTEDIFVSHEAELTQSGRYLLATDERGGGILPIGASCSPGADNPRGNGGIHAFPVSKLDTVPPQPIYPAPPVPGGPAPTPGANEDVDAYQENVYAQTSEGDRAIFRTPIETKPQGSLCTAHVFEQIPGQNRIFMGWYSQGTQVVDFTENRDGTIDFERAGFFILENANEWTSHVFKVQENTDGSFTYWGAAGDFALGDAGRNTIDIYRVTLPPPPKPFTESGEPLPGTPEFPTGQRPPSPSAGPSCASASGYNALRSKPRKKRKRVRFSFDTAGDSTVDATIFRRGVRRRVVRRRVATFTDRERSFTWGGRRTRNGFYDVRFKTEAPNGNKDVRHLSVRRKKGRFYNLPPFDQRQTCSLVKYESLGRSVFGGRKRTPLNVRFNLAKSAAVEIELVRRGKVVKTLKEKTYQRGKSRRKIRLGRKKSRRAAYRVILTATRPGSTQSVTLFTRHL